MGFNGSTNKCAVIVIMMWAVKKFVTQVINCQMPIMARAN